MAELIRLDKYLVIMMPVFCFSFAGGYFLAIGEFQTALFAGFLSLIAYIILDY